MIGSFYLFKGSFMYYRYFGGSDTQIMQFYVFSNLDNNYYHNFYSYYLNYQYRISIELIDSQYSCRVSFYDFSGMEDTAGMNCLIYLYSDLDGSYYTINSLPNASVDDFNLQVWGTIPNYNLVITCGYTSEFYNDGYINEYESGYQYGYQTGYSDGTGQGFKDAYDNGYADGKDVGYELGVNASDEQFSGVFGLLGEAFGSASRLMNVSIVGGLTIGTFTMIPIAITIVISIFKLMRK